MATLGKVDKFDVNKEEWSQYEERFTTKMKYDIHTKLPLESYQIQF